MEQSPPKIRLSRIEITNYKKIDHLVIDFPKPLMANDPDVFVLGSKNGGGKTSVLECCALAIAAWDDSDYLKLSMNKLGQHFFNTLKNDSNKATTIKAHFETKNNRTITDTSLAEIMIDCENKIKTNASNPYLKYNNTMKMATDLELDLCNRLLLSESLVLLNNAIFINSYRRVKHENPHLNNIKYNEFKGRILNLMLSSADLFEKKIIEDPKKKLTNLKEITKRYSQSEIIGLNPNSDGSIDIRLKLEKFADSISFNNLSSGQKEIISTLFMIYDHTYDNPSIVIIDEPELHLNAEWQQDYVYQLTKLMPHNQYILASHSKWIANGVEDNQRTLLEDDEE